MQEVNLTLFFHCAFHKHANSEVQKPTDDCVFRYLQWLYSFFYPLGFAETGLHKPIERKIWETIKNRFTWLNQRDCFFFFPVIKVCLSILPLRIWNSSRTWPSYVTEGSLWTLRKLVLTSGSCICMVRGVKIWRLFSAPVVVVFVLFNATDD